MSSRLFSRHFTEFDYTVSEDWSKELSEKSHFATVPSHEEVTKEG